MKQSQTLSPYKKALEQFERCWRQKSDGMYWIQKDLTFEWAADHQKAVERALRIHEDLVAALETGIETLCGLNQPVPVDMINTLDKAKRDLL